MFPIHLTSYPASQKYLFSWHHKLKDISNIISTIFFQELQLTLQKEQKSWLFESENWRSPKDSNLPSIRTIGKKVGHPPAQITDAEKLQASATYSSQTNTPWCILVYRLETIILQGILHLQIPDVGYLKLLHNSYTKRMAWPSVLKLWKGFFLCFHIPCADRHKQLLSIKSLPWPAWITLFFGRQVTKK